jgi:hypothetical protein
MYPPSYDAAVGFRVSLTMPERGDRALNAAEAERVAERFLAMCRIPWDKPLFTEPLGIHGYRLWFRTPAPERFRFGTRVLDVRLDGTVRPVNFPVKRSSPVTLSA